MRCLFPVIALLAFLTPERAAHAQTLEHAVGGTVADSLMEAWVQMWATDDVEGVAALYADDIVIHTDTLAMGLQGHAPVLKVTAQRMAKAGPLVINPDHSFQRGDLAYQTGRFLIDGETGAYSFIFHREKDRVWRLRFTYYLHDKLVGASD